MDERTINRTNELITMRKNGNWRTSWIQGSTERIWWTIFTGYPTKLKKAWKARIWPIWRHQLWFRSWDYCLGNVGVACSKGGS